MENTYRVSYHLGDSGFDIESTDKAWLEKKEKEYLSKLSSKSSRPTKQPEDMPQEKSVSVLQSLTINEFYRKQMQAHDVKSRIEMAVFFVYYLEKIQKKEAIKTADVTDCFAKIHYPGYNKLNIADILSKAKQRALLNYVNSLWSLTLTGEDYVINIISTTKK